MNISYETLFLLAPPKTTEKYGKSFSLYATSRFYCGPMTVRGLCTGSCLFQCATSIEKIFTSKEANNLSALAIWVAKQQVAIHAEEAAKRELPKQQFDEYGVPTEHTNPFVDLGNSIEG